MTIHRWAAIGLAPWLLAASPARVPDLDVARTCNSRGSLDQQSAGSCLSDERGAKRELSGLWGKLPAKTRQSCLDEVKIGGSPSYVEMLTCAQMNMWSSEGDAAASASTSRKPRP